MKRPYESMVVFDGTLPEDVLLKEQQQIEDLLKQQNADFEKTDVWGKRSLAYPIKKKKTGYYCLYFYEGEGDAIIALDRYVKLNERVLRHLTVQRNLKNDAAREALATRREKVPESDMDSRDSRTDDDND